MIVERVVIKRYKGIEISRLDLNRRAKGIIGTTGSGKSKILECIALTLQLSLFDEVKTLQDFDWPYFRIHNLLEKDTRVEIKVKLSKQEIDRFKEVSKIWLECNRFKDSWSEYAKNINPKACRSSFYIVLLPGNTDETRDVRSCTNIFKCYKDQHLINQLRTRYYIKDLESRGYSSLDLNDAPGIVVLTQYKAINEVKDRLQRIELIKWLEKHKGGGGEEDKLISLNKSLRNIFGNSIWIDSLDSRGNILIYNNREKSKYILEDLSCGERRVLDLLYEVISKEIKDSVVIIDQLGLNLDDNIARLFLRELTQLNNNQIIYSNNRSI